MGSRFALVVASIVLGCNSGASPRWRSEPYRRGEDRQAGKQASRHRIGSDRTEGKVHMIADHDVDDGRHSSARPGPVRNNPSGTCSDALVGRAE